MSLQDYGPGDIIQGDCLPFCKTVSIPSQKGRICDECFKDAHETGCSLKKCSGCTNMHYCNKTCQKNDWKNGHKIECGSKTFRKSFECRSTNELRCQLLRVFSFLKQNPELLKKGFPVYDGTTRCFDELMSHQESFESSPIHYVCAQIAKEMSAEGLGDQNVDRNTNYLLKLAGIVQTNGFSIYNLGETAKLGSGVYIEPSVFNHSCKPNARFCVKGTRMEIRALAPIKKGEEPFISYIAGHLGKSDRKTLLMSRYNFDCRCTRCESDDGVDFEKLNNLVSFFDYCLTDETFATSSSVLQMLNKHREVIEMMKKIYNEYDDRVTNQYTRAVYALINGGKYKGIHRIKILVRETKAHLKMSYGEDHNDYLKFQRAVSFYGIGV